MKIGLQNDLKALMLKIEQGLHNLHKLAATGPEQSFPGSASTSDGLQEVLLLEPFLRVNLVSPGSPAELAVRNFKNSIFFQCNIALYFQKVKILIYILFITYN